MIDLRGVRCKGLGDWMVAETFRFVLSEESGFKTDLAKIKPLGNNSEPGEIENFKEIPVLMKK